MTKKENDKLSFVLPVTFRESSSSTKNCLTWRRSDNELSPIRTRLLLASFLKNFEQNDLLDFFIVCPYTDVSSLASLVSSLTSDRRYCVIAENELGIDLGNATEEKAGNLQGWYFQQLLKLAISARIRSEHYVTLDSDIFCRRPFAYRSLIKGNLAVTNTESVDDYRRLYSPAFSAAEVYVKTMRYTASADILGYCRPEPARSLFYGETPVVMHTASVKAMLGYLTSRFSSPWSQTLASRPEWTEYSLYFQYLEMTEKFDALYMLAGCNRVLDLEKSVWQETRRYRHARIYDANHFTAHGEGNADGIFIAVQSWLPVSSWLPERYGSLQEFYREIEAWCL